MYISETKIRVRYGETDQMGICYYGNYPMYYEVARTDMLRELGLSYKQMENDGIILPVVSLSVQYLLPAYYDEVLTIKTILRSIPGVRITFNYEIYNDAGQLLNTGETTLAFINKTTRRPMKPPDYFLNGLSKYFQS